ncbi:MAG: ferritin-like domain-containing protein [Lysobacteraceae bacterium]|nr:MAG: ferritin-like domain-containing protein [Xanthomonadaceae bacterium]
MAQPLELRACALQSLLEPDPAAKTAGVAAMVAAHRDGAWRVDPDAALDAPEGIPGRPGAAAPVRAWPALDALWRFPGMPQDYYTDWLRVAGEEALHFNMLGSHLATLGYAYGDFSGHDSLWEMVEKTRGDVLARMALVPRTLEARGLDAIPPLRAKLAQAGDLEAAAILDVLLRDEVGHVEIGNRWYLYLCGLRALEPLATYAELALRYKAPVPKGPFNIEARRQAGFSEAELARFI